MLATVAAHISSIIVGWVASQLIWLTFGLLNMVIAMLLISVGSWLLLKVGATSACEALTTQVTNGMHWVTGGLDGIAKILLSLFIFSFFERQPGLVMLALFIGSQLFAASPLLAGSQRPNWRSGSFGTIFGLLLGWWAYYPQSYL